jgi:hypothetical protein
LWSEDFNGLPLGPNVEEPVAGTNVWTATPPAGWTVDNTGVPGANNPPSNNGVREWIGWTFADRNWWSQTAGDQQRSDFNLAAGTVMIADPDEWDDAPHPDSSSSGWYNTLMTTPPVPLNGAAAGTVGLLFDSSWRDECCDEGNGSNNQTARISVSYDGGPAIEVLRWESNPASPFFKNDATNESVFVELNNPAGAGEMSLTLSLTQAGNDWWWAVDNLNVFTGSPFLSLDVDTATGEMILSAGIRTEDIVSYEISSPNDSLTPDTWVLTNLEASKVDAVTDPSGATPGAGNDPGETWETLSAEEDFLWEAFLLGSSVFDSSRTQSIGYGYDRVEDSRDLVMRFLTVDGTIVSADVNYFASPRVPGDMDGDGDVDFDDIDAFTLGLSDSSAYLAAYGLPASVRGDMDGDGDQDFDDIAGFVISLGGELGRNPLAAPEPSTFALTVAGCLMAVFGGRCLEERSHRSRQL